MTNLPSKSIHDKIYILPADVSNFLIDEGFTEGEFDNAYSKAEGRVLFYKELEYDESKDYFTAIITVSGHIGIERNYECGGGCCEGVWTFDPKDGHGFGDVYDRMVDRYQKIFRSFLQN